ncbi:kinase-like protein [Gigaspora margarita]|uniref:Kinase-like protein n=1 Tax=Gigaspora margarita TaxID=4874 RepID=A0A8H4ADP9_GIGMA|nr:kinase-like protein [Gigaspora margarita]
MLKSDDQKSPLLESTSSEPKQDPNHIMISPKFPQTVDMIEFISKKSPGGRIPTRAPNVFIIYRKIYVETARENGYYLPMTIVSSMASQSWELTESIEQKLKELGVKMFNYLLFRELKYVGSGGYANVYSAKFYGQQYALKSLRNTLRLENKEAMLFIHELKILREVSHPNIINFYGVSKDPHTHNFMLILQLANGGTLRNYLDSKWKDDIFEIPWINLISIAVEITCGLRFLHEKKICHRDLHPNNILINDGKILISDFGISKKMDSTTPTSSVKGLPAYVEPRFYLYPDEKIKRDEKSDIYSLGVVLWEVTSGKPPFSDSPNHAIIIKISQGKREKIIAGTPIDYAKLYVRCWDSEPEKRPTSEEILNELERLSNDVKILSVINTRNMGTIQSPRD